MIDPEAVAELRSNRYVESVSIRSVTFTPECKQLVYQRLEAGEGIADALEALGIDTAVLGKGRLQSLRERLYQFAERPEQFANLQREKERENIIFEEERAKIRIKKLESEVVELRQMVEFLKKNKMLEMKYQREQRRQQKNSNS